MNKIIAKDDMIKFRVTAKEKKSVIKYGGLLGMNKTDFIKASIDFYITAHEIVLNNPKKATIFGSKSNGAKKKPFTNG
ncbi:MAG: hypothetical protein IID03_11730 [Candidatus Dadabacteria bacterium]|nr:hypothetical protein [Candidatus Dadabacteria bacterium]